METEMQPLEKLFNKVDDVFKTMARRFDDMDKRFEGMDQRFDRMDRRFDGIDARLDRHEILLRANSKELQLAVRTFETLHHDERGRLDVAKEALDQRLGILERNAELA